MSIRCANFTLISNHFARKRAPLCPLFKCYLKGEFNRLSWFKLQVVAKLVFAVLLYSFFGLASESNGRMVELSWPLHCLRKYRILSSSVISANRPSFLCTFSVHWTSAFFPFLSIAGECERCSFASVGECNPVFFPVSWFCCNGQFWHSMACCNWEIVFFPIKRMVLAARNQCSFAQLKPNGRVTWKFICRIGKYSARRAKSFLLKAVTLVGRNLLLATLGFQITKNSSRDILKWAFATRILCSFQTTSHASVLRYAP